MNYSKHLIPLTVMLWAILTSCQPSPDPQSASVPEAKEHTLRPNILLITADDLGWADLNCYGSTLVQSQHLDALARDGVQFMQAYAAAPTGTPARAALQTGLHPDRISDLAAGLNAEYETIGALAQRANYFTAYVGKWGLSATPKSQGYDRVFAAGTQTQPDSFYYPFFFDTPFPELQQVGKPGDYLSDILTEHTMQLMSAWAGQPWLISLNYYAPHVPIQGRKDWTKHYQELIDATHPRLFPAIEYAAMISALDANIGRLIAQLRTDGLLENTLIIFTSDNGGLHQKAIPDSLAAHTPPTDNGILRGGKGTIFEGGIRVPLIVHYPAGTTNTLAVDHAVWGPDIYSTLAEIFGRKDYSPSPDGQSLLPFLRGATPAQRTLRWASQDASATRVGALKTIIRKDSTFRYNLNLDPSESTPLELQ